MNAQDSYLSYARDLVARARYLARAQGVTVWSAHEDARLNEMAISAAIMLSYDTCAPRIFIVDIEDIERAIGHDIPAWGLAQNEVVALRAGAPFEVVVHEYTHTAQAPARDDAARACEEVLAYVIAAGRTGSIPVDIPYKYRPEAWGAAIDSSYEEIVTYIREHLRHDEHMWRPDNVRAGNSCDPKDRTPREETNGSGAPNPKNYESRGETIVSSCASELLHDDATLNSVMANVGRAFRQRVDTPADPKVENAIARLAHAIRTSLDGPGRVMRRTFARPPVWDPGDRVLRPRVEPNRGEITLLLDASGSMDQFAPSVARAMPSVAAMWHTTFVVATDELLYVGTNVERALDAMWGGGETEIFAVLDRAKLARADLLVVVSDMDTCDEPDYAVRVMQKVARRAVVLLADSELWGSWTKITRVARVVPKEAWWR